MFCQKCGSELPNDSKFCDKCGARQEVVTTTEITKVVTENIVKKSRKSKPMYYILAVLVIVAIIVAICIENVMSKVVKLNDFVTVEFTGYDSQGSAIVDFNTELFEEKYGDKIRLSKDEEFFSGCFSPTNPLFDNIDYELDKSDNLSNGDEIVLTWKFNNEDIKKKYGLTFKAEEQTFIVTGLTEISAFAPFAESEIQHPTIEPNGREFEEYTNKVPTVEELLLQLKDTEEISYCDVDVEMDISMNMDISNVLEGTVTLVKTKIDYNVKADSETQHTKGELNVNLLGTDVMMPLEEYTAIEGENVYTYIYDEEHALWTMELTEKDEWDSLYNNDDWANILENLEAFEMKEIQNDDTTYTITGVMSMEKSLVSFIEDFMSGFTSKKVNLSGIMNNITLIFDRETLKLNSVELVVIPDSIAYEVDLIEEIVVYMTYNEYSSNSENNVTIPTSIIREAVDVSKK